MPDVQEVFRAATDKVRPDPGALARQHRRQRRAGNNRRLAAFAAVASIAVAAIAGIVLLENRGEPDPIMTQPALEQGLYLVDVRTGETTPFHDPGEGTYDFELSPDGSTLIMVRFERDREQIWLADADGTNLRRLTNYRYGAVEPTWFPDGERIAFVAFDGNANRQVFMLDLATRERTQLTYEPPPAGAFSPSVTPDGESLLYGTTREGTDGLPGPRSNPEGQIKVVDLQTGTTSILIQNDQGWAFGPVMSANGVIAYGSKTGPPGDERPEVWLRTPDGDERVLVPLSDTVTWATGAMWSPDGSLLAYCAQDAERRWNGWVYDTTTGGSRMVAPGCNESWYGNDRLLIWI